MLDYHRYTLRGRSRRNKQANKNAYNNEQRGASPQQFQNQGLPLKSIFLGHASTDNTYDLSVASLSSRDLITFDIPVDSPYKKG